MPYVLSRHSHLSEDFRLSSVCARSDKGSDVPRLEEGSAMSMLIVGQVDEMTF